MVHCVLLAIIVVSLLSVCVVITVASSCLVPN